MSRSVLFAPTFFIGRAIAIALLVAACNNAPRVRTTAEVRDSLVFERQMLDSLRARSQAKIRHLDSDYALIDRRRVERIRALDSLLATSPR